MNMNQGMGGPMNGMGNMNQGMGGNPAGMFQHMNNSQVAQQLDSVLKNDEMIDSILMATFPDVSADQRPMFKEMIKKQLAFMKNNPEQMQAMLNNPQAMGMMQRGMGQGMNQGMGGAPNMNYGMNNNMNNPYMMNYAQQPYYPPQNNNYAPLTKEQEKMSDEMWAKTFANELKLMEEMGFKNKYLNLEALKKTNGNIPQAIDLMERWMS